MKKLLFTIMIAMISLILYAESEPTISVGASFAAGGRYDEVRMCVASPAGFKGGPAFEFAGFVMEAQLTTYFGIGCYIPLARPLLFAAAFQMLQFLPEAVISFHIPVATQLEIATDIGLGASLHYGPDYKSGLAASDPHNPAFFAAGPRASIFGGVIYHINKNIMLKTGVRPYFEYLISDTLSGKIIGAELDFQVRYAFHLHKND